MTALRGQTWKMAVFLSLINIYFIFNVYIFIFKERDMESKKKFKPDPSLKLPD